METFSCRWCKHVDQSTWISCKAFDRIPMFYLDGREKHDRVLDGQREDVVYEPDPKTAPKRAFGE